MKEMEYTTVLQNGESRFEDRKSVFLGHAAPVKTEKEAVDFVNSIRKQFPDARHNVYAYLLRENAITRYSDDREPQGTAGLPVLDVLRKANITDTAIVVTRYFGGTLLGTGGLVRAYTAAAKAAVDAAKIVVCRKMQKWCVGCSYGDYQKLLPVFGEFSSLGLCIEDTAFSDAVNVVCAIPDKESDGFKEKLIEVTDGRVKTELLESYFGLS